MTPTEDGHAGRPPAGVAGDVGPGTPEGAPRVLLVCHAAAAWGEDLPFREALSRRMAVTEHIVDAYWPASIDHFDDYDSYRGVIWFTRFRVLRTKAAFDWGRYGGRRLMYDWDACQDFSRLAGGRYLGQWKDVFERHGFHELVCTGRRTRDHFIEKGVAAHWIPKGFDHRRFHDLGLPRTGVGSYGVSYTSRSLMLDHLRRKGISVDVFRAPHDELNERLNRLAACVISNLEVPVPRRLARVLNRGFGGRLLPLREGPEPMLKNFEVPASGAVAFCDRLGELEELGFVDGETVVTYSSFPELADRLVALLDDPDQLGAIGRRGTRLAMERHTWDHRAEALAALLGAAPAPAGR